MLAEAVVKNIASGTEPLETPSQAPQAKEYYKKAIASIDVNKVKESKRRAYEGLILNSLYEDYEEAIKYALQYQTEEPGNPSPLILAYLGFAYGQQYKAAQKAGKPVAELDEIKRKSLESIKRALQMEPNLKSLVRMVWDPNDVAKFPGSEDDDLEVFKDDSDFKALLGSA
jgi:tetratricopeptide (TPR) repeat protein